MAQRDIELILVRQWASYLTMPIFIADAGGNLLYYNEPAEAILGRRYDEAGEMPVEELSRIFQTTDDKGVPVSPADLPLGIAVLQHRPAHGRLRLKGLDGQWRLIDATAFPVEGQGGRNLGAIAIFWEVEGA